MDIRESIRIALEALSSNMFRSFLTMLGVIIGVTAVILLVAVGEGSKESISRELAGLGANILIVMPGKTSTSGGIYSPLMGPVRRISYEDALVLKRRCSALSEACPIVFGTAKAKSRNLSRDVTVVGTSPEFERVRNIHVEIGRFITREDVEGKRRVLILGQRVKRELFGEGNPLGKMVSLSNAKYRVVGLMARKGVSLGLDIDDLIFIPVRSAQELFDTDRLFQILAAAISANEVEKAVAQTKETLIQRHANREDFTILTQGAILSTMETIMNVLTGVLAGIAAISLVVGGIGIMNIMLAGARERTREIGIRKAIGARNRDILGQFLIESMTLSLIGGLLGILLGVGGAVILSLLVPYIPIKVSLWSISLAFCFATAVGIFFGIYPAHRASLQDPIVALRFG